MRKTVVEARGLRKDYPMGEQTVHALCGVDLTIREGEQLAIIGKSGCGKSTLLHLLGGLDTPTDGQLVVDGNALAALNRTELALFRRRRVGFVFQQYNLLEDLTVYDNVVFPLMLDGVAIDGAFVETLLDALHLSDKRAALPSQLSGGEQQRVAVARALVTRPALVLADEPTGNLDTVTSHAVMGLLKQLAARYQQTLVVVTHDMDIAQLADRIVRMNDGRIVEEVSGDGSWS